MSGWIGVDLDCTLAVYHGWTGSNTPGEPVPAMLKRVKKWVAEGRQVKIFTARAYCKLVPELADSWEEIEYDIHAWLVKHGLPKLEITCVKDFGMITLYDDRAIQVEANTGRLIHD